MRSPEKSPALAFLTALALSACSNEEQKPDDKPAQVAGDVRAQLSQVSAEPGSEAKEQERVDALIGRSYSQFVATPSFEPEIPGVNDYIVNCRALGKFKAAEDGPNDAELIRMRSVCDNKRARTIARNRGNK